MGNTCSSSVQEIANDTSSLPHTFEFQFADLCCLCDDSFNELQGIHQKATATNDDFTCYLDKLRGSYLVPAILAYLGSFSHYQLFAFHLSLVDDLHASGDLARLWIQSVTRLLCMLLRRRETRAIFRDAFCVEARWNASLDTVRYARTVVLFEDSVMAISDLRLQTMQPDFAHSLLEALAFLPFSMQRAVPMVARNQEKTMDWSRIHRQLSGLLDLRYQAISMLCGGGGALHVAPIHHDEHLHWAYRKAACDGEVDKLRLLATLNACLCVKSPDDSAQEKKIFTAIISENNNNNSNNALSKLIHGHMYEQAGATSEKGSD